MNQMNKNLIDFSISVWKGNMEKYERLFIALNIPFKDVKTIIAIINRNGFNWIRSNKTCLEEIKLQFVTECLTLTSLNSQESTNLFNQLFLKK